jgi:DNA-binding transcriptional LysR family regulator
MDRTSSALLFVRVVETSSFSKAATEFGISQPTATKAIAAIEARLGMRLLHRSTRGVALTEFGTLYYEKCKDIERAVEEADNLATLKEGSAGGQLRISTSVAFGRRLLTPLVLRYMQANPQVKVDISFDDRYTDLVGQGIDVAIRMGQMADSTLGARYLGANPWVMVASPAYLESRGEPVVAQDLSEHACLVYSSVQQDDRWRLVTPQGKVVSVAVAGSLRSNNLSPVLAAASSGMGLAILPWYVAREGLLTAAVRVVMADHTLPTQDVHAVFPSPKLVPQKVTAFIDYLQQSLAGEWWLRAP